MQWESQEPCSGGPRTCRSVRELKNSLPFFSTLAAGVEFNFNYNHNIHCTNVAIGSHIFCANRACNESQIGLFCALFPVVRTPETRLSVLSTLFKQQTCGLVVRWVARLANTRCCMFSAIFVLFFFSKTSPDLGCSNADVVPMNSFFVILHCGVFCKLSLSR